MIDKKDLEAEHAYQCQVLSIKTFVDYFVKIGSEPENNQEALLIQNILNCEIVVYLLQRKHGTKQAEAIEALLEQREDLVDKYEMLYEKYTELNKFYNL